MVGHTRPNLQGGGRWFETSIAHYERPHRYAESAETRYPQYRQRRTHYITSTSPGVLLKTCP
jgi:hypothetical protein